METILVRHGIAEEPEEAELNGRGDPERRLTKEGREKAERVAQGLRKRIGRVDLIAHSPYVRARETAEIFASSFRHAELQAADCLTPHHAPRSFLPILKGLQEKGVVMVVGHEPHLSVLASFLLTGREHPILEFKKAGVASIEWQEAGLARLNFFISPKFI